MCGQRYEIIYYYAPFHEKNPPVRIKKLTGQVVSNEFLLSAVRTRLELVTSCVTGRHSNLLN